MTKYNLGYTMTVMKTAISLPDTLYRAANRLARALAELTRGSASEPTFVFRAGHPERAVPPSPRRPVDDVVI